MRPLTLDTRPESLDIDLAMTAVIVVDMQNAFASRGGLVCKIAFAGPVTLGLGRLATLTGRHGDAQAWLESAEASAHALDAAPFVLRARLDPGPFAGESRLRIRLESLDDGAIQHFSAVEPALDCLRRLLMAVASSDTDGRG